MKAGRLLIAVLISLLVLFSCESHKAESAMSDNERMLAHDYVTALAVSNLIDDVNSAIEGTQVTGLTIDDNTVMLDDYALAANLIVAGDFTFTSLKDDSYGLRSLDAVFNDEFIFDEIDIVVSSDDRRLDSGSIKIADRAEAQVDSLTDFQSLPLADYQKVKDMYIAVNTLLYNKKEAVTNGTVAYEENQISYAYTPYASSANEVETWAISFSTEDIAFTLFSNSYDSVIDFNDEIYVANTAGIILSVSTPGSGVKPFAWDITVKSAKRTDREYTNWNYVTKDISITDGNIYNLEIEEADMIPVKPSMSLEEGKWFALLIGTGESDFSKIECNGAALPETEGAFTDFKGNPRESDEFVLWLSAEDLLENGRGDKVFEKELVFSRDDAISEQITIKVVDSDNVVSSGYLFGKDEYQIETEDGIIFRGTDENGDVPEPVI